MKYIRYACAAICIAGATAQATTDISEDTAVAVRPVAAPRALTAPATGTTAEHLDAQTPATMEKAHETAGDETSSERSIDKDDDADTSENTYTKETRTRYSHYIGVSAGFITGYGMSFRKWFDNAWGFELNLLPIYHETHYPENRSGTYSYEADSGYSNKGTLCVGLTYLKTLVDLRYTRVLFYAGGNLQTAYEKWNYYYWDYTWDEARGASNSVYVHTAGKNYENKINVGLGAGCEWYVWRFAFHCMLGFYGGYLIERTSYEAQPSIEGGIHFRF